MTEVPRTQAEFVHWLVDRHPGLAPVLEEHLAVYDELLPHVSFGDVTRYASALAHESTDTAGLDRLLADLDNARLGGTDDEVGTSSGRPLSRTHGETTSCGCA